ncbi:MAG: HEAT repeat domain-containing protein [Candidatus Latescibacteria bacterium]|nr:HEAT repeat domain-containing protein [Candidatus Latescibacterota bacterium]
MEMDRQRERALAYLYDEMSVEAKNAFETELAENPSLRRLLEEEERFHRVCPAGAGVQVSEDLLGESRLLLRAALRRERERRISPLSRLADLFRSLTIRYVGGAVALLLLGVFLGRTALGPVSGVEKGLPGSVGPDPLEIVDLRVVKIDPSTGAIQLSFAAASRMMLDGNLRDETVQNVLAAAVRGDLESASRLEAIDLMQRQTASAKVREALIYALLRDENPGVRIKAVEALKDLVQNEPVRQALLDALAHDRNAGVRIGAIEALKPFQDPKTLRVLEQMMTADDNAYIRAEARRAVLRWRGTPHDPL